MIPTLSDALAARGFETLTDVQQAVTAPELTGADLLVSAQTGSGKTVGFGLAIATTLLGEETHFGPAAAPMALVVAPTRELALQVQRELEWLYANARAQVVSCIGGMDARAERRSLERGAHIVVGTPGRLRDHITRGALDLSDIRAIVLDEADEMLDLGFREDLEFMLGEAPEDRRTLMFSATVPPSIEGLAKQYQRDAVRVSTLTKGSQHADISYQAVQVSAQDAEHAIINLLRYHDATTAIVFANTRAAVARLTARFSNRGFSVVSLSGELSQDERSHAIQALRDGRAKVCVATDVAARGLDLPNLELVIHADLPTNTEALLHRSGRTGRAGRKGLSALIVPDRIVKKARLLLKWAKIEAEWVFAPTPEEILAKDEERLLADPLWQAEATPEEAAFAAKLLEQHGAERIAAACMRLYQGRLSAPEELNAPAAAGREERAPFGPSAWFAISAGRNERAEARWLLPLLCRAGNLDKVHIGKIWIDDTESYVEIAEAAVPGLMNQLGADGVLEGEMRLRRMDSAPAAVTERRQGTRPERPAGKGPQGDKPFRKSAPRDDARPPRPARPAGEDARPARDPSEKREYRKPSGEGFDKRPKPAWGKTEDGPRKPRAKVWDGEKSGSSGKPAGKPAGAGRPDKPKWSDKPGRADKPAWSSDKPKSDRPYSDRPKSDKFGKPGGPGKFDKPGKPARPAKPGSAKPGVPGARVGASDPSQSLKRGKGKPRVAGPRGGDAAPRRKG